MPLPLPVWALGRRGFQSPAGHEFLFLADHAQEVLDLRDHAAGLRRVGNLGGAPDPVELEPDQGLALGMVAADWTSDLLALDHLGGFSPVCLPAPVPNDI